MLLDTGLQRMRAGALSALVGLASPSLRVLSGESLHKVASEAWEA